MPKLILKFHDLKYNYIFIQVKLDYDEISAQSLEIKRPLYKLINNTLIRLQRYESNTAV